MAIRQNNGIIVSGRGRLKADVLAVGYQARAEKRLAAAGEALAAKGLADVQTPLATLMAALEQHGSGLVDPQPVFELAERVAGALEAEKPDKLTLRSFLTALVEETRSVTEIAGAALALKNVVTSLF